MQIGYKKSSAENAISLLQGVDEGVQRYAQGRRYREHREDERADRDRGYGLRLKEDARQDEANRRANDAAARDAQVAPDRARSIKAGADFDEARAKSAKSQLDAEEEFARQQKTQEEFEAQVEADSHRQEQAQEYKRITGKDLPDDFFESDWQGHKPGEPGWHWTQYDLRSPIPIKEQINFNREASNLSTLPPDATRAEKMRKLREDTHNRIIADAKQSVLEEAQRALLPDAKPGSTEEADPALYLPPEKFKDLQKAAKDPTVSADEMRKTWDTIQKSHDQEVSYLESRSIAVQDLDLFAQKAAQMQQDYDGMVGRISSEDFERFREARHAIERSKLHGGPLDNAVREAKAFLTPGPKPKKDPQNDKTGFNAGEAIKTATAALSNTPEYLQAKPEQRDAMVQAQASKMLRMAQSLAGGDMPGEASGSGSHPNTPDDQARASAAVSKETGKPDPKDAPALQAKAKAAGWTKAEFVEWGNTGKAPAGKPPIQ